MALPFNPRVARSSGQQAPIDLSRYVTERVNCITQRTASLASKVHQYAEEEGTRLTSREYRDLQVNIQEVESQLANLFDDAAVANGLFHLGRYSHYDLFRIHEQAMKQLASVKEEFDHVGFEDQIPLGDMSKATILSIQSSSEILSLLKTPNYFNDAESHEYESILDGLERVALRISSVPVENDLIKGNLEEFNFLLGEIKARLVARKHLPKQPAAIQPLYPSSRHGAGSANIHQEKKNLAKPKSSKKSSSAASSASSAPKKEKSPQRLLLGVFDALIGNSNSLEKALDALEEKAPALRSAIHKEMNELAAGYKTKSDPKWGRIVFLGKEDISKLCSASPSQLQALRQQAVLNVQKANFPK